VTCRAYDRKTVALFGEFTRVSSPEDWPAQRRAEVCAPRETAGKKKLDFCKMDLGPIFFKEILFFDFLEEST